MTTWIWNMMLNELNSICMYVSPKSAWQKKSCWICCESFRSQWFYIKPLIQQEKLLLHAHSLLSLFQVGSSRFLRKLHTWNHCFAEGILTRGEKHYKSPQKKTPPHSTANQNWLPAFWGIKKWGRVVYFDERSRSEPWQYKHNQHKVVLSMKHFLLS